MDNLSCVACLKHFRGDQKTITVLGSFYHEDCLTRQATEAQEDLVELRAQNRDLREALVDIGPKCSWEGPDYDQECNSFPEFSAYGYDGDDDYSCREHLADQLKAGYLGKDLQEDGSLIKAA